MHRTLPRISTFLCRQRLFQPIRCKRYETTFSDTATLINSSRRVVSIPSKMNEMKLRCTEFDQTGAVKTTAGEFLKSDFCQHHSLLPRDLRTIDTYSIYQKPTILVRPEAILVNMAHLKALIKSDMVVLFDTFGSADSYNQSIFIYDLQERLKSQKDGLPFEFRALEAILISVTSSLQSELDILDGPVNKILSDLEDLADIEESMNGDKLRDLLQYSKKLSKFEQDALSIRDVLEEVLDNDDDLAAMYLSDKQSGRPRAPSEHEEIELLLEAYYKQTEEIAAKAETLRQHMRSTEEIIQLLLDVSRNSLMWYDIRLTIITLSATVVSGFGAIFGMNLRNYFEDDPYAFGVVSGLAMMSGLGAFAIAVKKLRRFSKLKHK
ncbi:Mitochondrial inner membrane magnesium transporter mrs2 [Choanephora cucurbitarum]|uniref:Magnesium transporter n=1 Tax=Choanephora cucurbitarum TaxID=101091 RepID=A0A1C7NI23_9FUNG|nr:Mitochondrial inner membrane magnesium transporter mrs2 [Choanephora cucurbitarum]